MKQLFLHITSMLLAVLVLFSTFSFTIEKHLCAGEIADVSFTGNLERCQMPDQGHNSSNETAINKIPCCQDIVETIDSANEDLTIVKELKLQEQYVVLAYITSYIKLYEGVAQSPTAFKHYEPPLVSKDIQVLYDTFLI